MWHCAYWTSCHKMWSPRILLVVWSASHPCWNTLGEKVLPTGTSSTAKAGRARRASLRRFQWHHLWKPKWQAAYIKWLLSCRASTRLLQTSPRPRMRTLSFVRSQLGTWQSSHGGTHESVNNLQILIHSVTFWWELSLSNLDCKRFSVHGSTCASHFSVRWRKRFMSLPSRIHCALQGFKSARGGCGEEKDGAGGCASEAQAGSGGKCLDTRLAVLSAICTKFLKAARSFAASEGRMRSARIWNISRYPYVYFK